MKFLLWIFFLYVIIRAAVTERDNNEVDKGGNQRVPLVSDLAQTNPKEGNDDVSFVYYPDNTFGIHELTIETGHLHGLNRANLSNEIPYKFIIPGFFQSCDSTFSKRMVAAYRLRMDKYPDEKYQIICVDWRGLSGVVRTDKAWDYIKLCDWMEMDALDNAPMVADRTVEFIQFLRKEGKIRSIGDIHIIGFGVGSHIAAHIGSTLGKIGNHSALLGRITALDPPKEGQFRSEHSLKKLNRVDAKFVDVYHTDAAGYGTSDRLGHVDFFPNGGGMDSKYQPYYNCTRYDMEWFTSLPFSGLLNRLINRDFIKTHLHCRGRYTTEALCNHNLAYVFYAMSILNDKIMAYKSKNYGELLQQDFDKNTVEKATFGEFVLQHGEPAPQGTYYLQITPQHDYRGLTFFGEIDR